MSLPTQPPPLPAPPSSVCRVGDSVGSLERLHHLLLPGRRRPVQGETFFSFFPFVFCQSRQLAREPRRATADAPDSPSHSGGSAKTRVSVTPTCYSQGSTLSEPAAHCQSYFARLKKNRRKVGPSRKLQVVISGTLCVRRHDPPIQKSSSAAKFSFSIIGLL